MLQVKAGQGQFIPFRIFQAGKVSVSFYLGADHLTCGGGGSGGGGGMGDLFKNIILQTVFEGKKSCKEIPGEKNILPWKKYPSSGDD